MKTKDFHSTEFRIFGHRGAKAVEPENTLRAIRAAFTQGARWIEVDLQPLESELIVLHDFYLDRTTNGRGRVKDCSLAEVRKLDAGKGEKIPLLEEVLELAREYQGGVNLEMKGQGCATILAEKLRTQLANSGGDTCSLLVSSFDHLELEQLRSLLPDVAVAPLFSGRQPFMLEIASRLQAFSIHLSIESIDTEIVARAHGAGLMVYVYTVNNRRDYDELRTAGVDGIFTDNPTIALEWVRHSPLGAMGE